MTPTAASQGRETPARRIGLLTLPLHTNYGGILQAVALRRHLVDLGAEVVLLRREQKRSLPGRLVAAVGHLFPEGILKALAARQQSAGAGGLFGKLARAAAKVRHQRQKRVHDAVIASALPLQTPLLYGEADMCWAVKTFELDTVIVGSDQVWRVRYQPPDAVSDYFLGFARSPAVRKIAYAASFGTGEWEAPDQVATASQLLLRFDAISVREASGVELCRSLFGQVEVTHVVDPTLLIDPAFYDTLAAPSDCAAPALLQYVLDPNADTEAFGREIAGALGLPLRSLLLDEADEPIDIPAWLRAFKDAEFVITNSFHGMVFSIIFQKNFIALVNEQRGVDRFFSLLSGLGIEDRLVDRPDSELALRCATKPIDYDVVGRRLTDWRILSADFLRGAMCSIHSSQP